MYTNFDEYGRHAMSASPEGGETDELIDERDKTEDLEDEELDTAEEEEEEEAAMMTDGQILYELLVKRDLVSDGSWFNLVPDLRAKWDTMADELDVAEIREDIVSELKAK